MRSRAGALLAVVLGLVGPAVVRAAATVRVLTVEPADPKEKEVNVQTVKEFEAANPGVRVEFEYLEDPGKTRCKSGTGSDTHRGRGEFPWSYRPC